MTQHSKSRTDHYYLCFTSTGYWTIYDAQTCQSTVVGRDETEARAVLKKWQNPAKEKLPYRKSLDEVLDKLLDEKDGIKPDLVIKDNDNKVKKSTRTYGKMQDRLADPAILAILANVTGRNHCYYRGDARYPLMVELTKLTGSTKISSRIIAAAWNANIITGERIRRVVNKKETLG